MDECGIQKFLAVYWIPSNPNTSSKLSPAELMFARKIRSIFNRPKRKIPRKVNFNTKIYKPGDKVFLGTTELERVTGRTVLLPKKSEQ